MTVNTAGGLPDFPEGTILVKTFYYYNDRRDPAKGKRIIETRLEIKSNSRWNVATYLWNAEQTDAVLATTGFNTTVNWIDQQGKGRVISYHVPSNRECATCHNSSDAVIPIGPKLRNLNTTVTRNATAVNQLTYFYNSGILEAVDPHTTPELPAWNDASYTLAERGRAYLDVNCAHCHKSGGIASDAALFFDYDKSFHDTGINSKKKAIVDKMKSGQMPRIGTSIVHDEGLELIRKYIDSL
jgi:mono/diheme cytochrome c family protein